MDVCFPLGNCSYFDQRDKCILRFSVNKREGIGGEGISRGIKAEFVKTN